MKKKERKALANRINWYIFIVFTVSLTFNIVQASAYASLKILLANPELVESSIFTKIMH